MTNLPAAWAACRPPAAVLHLDSGAASRPSRATLDAVTAHALLEARVGAYVAQEEAAGDIAGLRRDVAALVGIDDVDGLAFVESATAGLRALLDCWPLGIGDRVAVVASEWGPNLEAISDHGLAIQFLSAAPSGEVDLDALAHTLASDPPAVVHLTPVASHRALIQPIAEVAALCREHGVPLWLDVAQAAGHIPVDVDADAAYGTSRKWLAGPRGVGFVGIARRRWHDLVIHRSAMDASDLPPVLTLESHEAHVSGRIGLAVAVREFEAFGGERVFRALRDVGERTRAALGEVPGWDVVGRRGAAITALRPTSGQDVYETRARLLAEHRILTTACSTSRAPREMTEPLLRLSPHVDCRDEDLERTQAALALN